MLTLFEFKTRYSKELSGLSENEIGTYYKIYLEYPFEFHPDMIIVYKKRANKDKFPWITMSILLVAIVVLLIINKSALPDKTKVNVGWGMMCGLMVGMFTFIGFGVRKMLKNTKRFKMFRSTLKIGDMTDEGVVMDIEGDEVTLAKTTKLHLVYPPKSDEDNINLI